MTVLVFIGLLLVLVLAHEWGHFIVARGAGCGVEEFAFGFPPRLFSFVRRGTRYSFNLLPIGGYVKIEGEDMDDPYPGPTNFASKTPLKRLLVLAAGVLMNAVLAAVLLSIQAGIGIPTLVTEENVDRVHDIKTFIVDVAANSPAEQAGIKTLDRVVSIDAVTNPTPKQNQNLLTKKFIHTTII